MYDAITPSRILEIENNPQIVAGYVNGKWPSYNGYRDASGNWVESTRQVFPNAIHVSIAVTADADAQVLDVEQYNATPAESVDWAIRQRKRGQIPTVYCSESDWPKVRDAFQTRNVPEPVYWIANWDQDTTIYPTAVAKQHTETSGYDVSSVRDYWPGVDKGPSPHTEPVPSPTDAHTYRVQPGDTLSGIGKRLGVSWQAIYALNHDTIGNPDLIYPGQILTLPGKPKPAASRVIHYVVSGETLSGIASHYGLHNWQTLYAANRNVIGSNPNMIHPGQRLVIPS